MESSFRVSICGGGIGGLTLALVIAKYGKLSVDIFEAGPTITTVGAGIGFFGRTMDIMKELGLYDELIKMAISPPREGAGPIFRKSDQPDGYHWFPRNLKRGTFSVHRKDLVNFLFRQISDSCKIHTSKKLDFYDVNSETGKITLHFRDGSSAFTDVLVGADGIRSATRKTMYRNLASSARKDEHRKRLLSCIDPVWTGMLVYRNLIQTEKLMKEYQNVEISEQLTLHLGKDKHIVTFPVSQGRLINVVIFCHNNNAFGTPFKNHWVMDVSEKEVSDQFKDWELGVRAVAKCIERPSRWALHSVRPLPHYVEGTVALLGDAAHAMEPHLGAGAGQAMEDAFILGRLLTHELTHRGNVADALKTYEHVRLPFANDVAQRSRDVGQYYGFQPASSADPDHVRRSIEDAWEWQSKSSGLSQWSDAEALWCARCSPHAKLQPSSWRDGVGK